MTNQNYIVKSPILFLIFNRPDVTTSVFEQIKKVKPSRLYIAADGPRKGKNNEEELCFETRLIVSQIDWDCEVKTLFREVNLGCKYAVSSAISWFFDNEVEGIILEDDCLPHEDFFLFCDELLNKYREDSRIRHIGGSNFQMGKKWGNNSYYFSNLTHVWGWASWRRAWRDYDVELSNYKNIELLGVFNSIFNNNLISDEWNSIFNQLLANKIDTWDYQLTITNLLNNGLSIIPNVNLIKNIGFGPNATHTFDTNNKFSNQKTEKLNQINHPVLILPQKEADLLTMNKEFDVKKRRRRARRKFIRKFKFWKKY